MSASDKALTGLWLHLCSTEQELRLKCDESVVHTWSISTALNGLGEQNGSGCTPRGWHRIRAKIGAEQPMGAVFRGRRPTGEVHSPTLHKTFPERDWILSRILWLCGEEGGFNRGGDVDSQRRYIYIHGTPDQFPMGQPLSHGCVRMKNSDVVDLFDKVSVGTKLLIQ